MIEILVLCVIGIPYEILKAYVFGWQHHTVATAIFTVIMLIALYGWRRPILAWLRSFKPDKSKAKKMSESDEAMMLLTLALMDQVGARDDVDMDR